MNNAVRRDIAATMARKDYKELHNLDMGAYISQFSNNIERIESLAWNPFFAGVDYISKIILSVIAIASIHWSLLIVAGINTLFMVLAPNPDKPEKILQFLHISSTIKKNVGGCVHVTYR